MRVQALSTYTRYKRKHAYGYHNLRTLHNEVHIYRHPTPHIHHTQTGTTVYTHVRYIGKHTDWYPIPHILHKEACTYVYLVHTIGGKPYIQVP